MIAMKIQISTSADIVNLQEDGRAVKKPESTGSRQAEHHYLHQDQNHHQCIKCQNHIRDRENCSTGHIDEQVQPHPHSIRELRWTDSRQGHGP
ncbi:hypothetical protein DPMN_039984 [Dreissena polymorpha]|uniref:Uncharacterized protein n=1 Tax=Dreissena polymorpha TaxID=45954 RepID=A0A9D4HSM0_DREPO|nr:hypothetical protein DPMN_039984 [Dreissena polymorpha]